MPTSPPYVSAQVNEIKREQFEIVSEGLCTNGFYGGRKFGTTWRITALCDNENTKSLYNVEAS
jgi:hypothetical protein